MLHKNHSPHWQMIKSIKVRITSALKVNKSDGTVQTLASLRIPFFLWLTWAMNLPSTDSTDQHLTQMKILFFFFLTSSAGVKFLFQKNSKFLWWYIFGFKITNSSSSMWQSSLRISWCFIERKPIPFFWDEIIPRFISLWKLASVGGGKNKSFEYIPGVS